MFFTDERMRNYKKDIESRAQNKSRDEKADPIQKAEKEVITEINARIEGDIGYRLKEVREQMNLTQEVMVEKLYPLAPTGKGAYGRYENGDRAPDLAFWVMLADRFDVDLHWLFTGEHRDRPSLPVHVSNAMQVIADYCQSGNKGASN